MLESQYHQSVTHTGFTHLLMEGVSVCMHRNLSDRHPIYKILIPHFHYMHGKNTGTRDVQLPAGGYVDKNSYIGRVTMLRLISKHNENWAYSTHASTVTSLETREAMRIPGYFIRIVSILVCISNTGQQCPFNVRNSKPLTLYKLIFVCQQNRRSVQRGARIKVYLN